MNLTTSVFGVDGQSESIHYSEDAGDALKFLKHADHEGSSLKLRIECYDPDEVYKLLKIMSQSLYSMKTKSASGPSQGRKKS